MKKLFHLSEVIDIDVLQKIQDFYSKATELSVVTVDYMGNPITKYSNFTDYCSLIRKDVNCKEKCYYSDAHGGLEAARIGRPYIYKCPGGLVDFAIPIIWQGQYMGSIMAGQVKVDEEFFDIRKTEEEVIKQWHNSPEIVDAYMKIPVIEYDKIKASANMMHIVANYIVEKNLVNVYKEELNKKNMELLKKTKTKLELEKALKTAEIKALQSQLNPHFLFNVLNTIGRLALLEGANRTEELAISFAEMMRDILKKSNQIITLKEEINYVEKYLKIQKIRFDNMIEYSIDIQEEILNIKIPFMTLQPFVENSINHGLRCKENGGYVKIIGKSVGEYAYIRIIDNGVGMPNNKIDMILNNSFLGNISSNSSTGVGIKNVNDMLVNYFGEKYDIKIRSKINSGTTVEIKIPKIIDSRSVLNV